MSLEQKVEAYEEYFEQHYGYSHDARLWISWYGLEAADKMVPYIRGESRGIPVREAVGILSWVQLRGCSLEEHGVVDDLKRLQERTDDEDFANNIGTVLKAIREDQSVPESEFDSVLPPGPCWEPGNVTGGPS